LRNVKVHRGTDMAEGSISDSAGIWLANVTGVVVLDDIEVTGHGKGNGIALFGLVEPKLGRLHVHDMRFSAASASSEQLIGIRLENCSRFTLPQPLVHGIDSEIASVVRAVQTDGITIAGCSDFTLLGPQVYSCGEGIDITGGAGNKRFSIVGGNLRDIDSFGIKCANSASFGLISDVNVRDAGYSGFVVSGPAESGLPKCEHIRFVNCNAINTGSNGNWSTQLVAGFAIMSGAYDPTWPQHIRFINCLALDNQPTKTMKYGYRNENNNTANKLISCESIGHTLTSTIGTFV
jgi:hypothetical protein